MAKRIEASAKCLEMQDASMAALAKNYLLQHGYKKRPEMLQEDEKLVQGIILPLLGQMQVADITQDDIEAFLHKKLEEMPYQANRVLSLLTKMFSLAVLWEWTDHNPAVGVEKYPEQKKQFPNEEEINQLWHVLDSHRDDVESYVLKFLMLTGARKNEVLQATWEQFSLEQGIWEIPPQLTKHQKTVHLPLSTKALEVLHNVKKLTPKNSQYVFPHDLQGRQMLKEIKTFLKTVLAEAKLSGIRISDLRQVHSSHLV